MTFGALHVLEMTLYAPKETDKPLRVLSEVHIVLGAISTYSSISDGLSLSPFAFYL